MEDLIELEERFQPFLQSNDYTFIGPMDMALMENFMRQVNLSAPVIGLGRTIHDALSHKPSVHSTLLTLPLNTALRIYVVINEGNNLIHATIEDYCERFGLDFE
ncbi:hypothetical protein [Cellulophaga sp. Ld12]|uniref:hypothetical protein n=1 Tax=Cellulophaga sp. Ld12 TaxID=3229535 RepID=UPI0038654EE7